jgi:hypothetical protein
MQMTNTSVLARRTRINGEYATLPYEAGWATEAVFFIQAEGDHADLTVAAEVSPDGITWIQRGASVVLGTSQPVAELALAQFGNWLRLTVTGASTAKPARILIHLNLKG